MIARFTVALVLVSACGKRAEQRESSSGSAPDLAPASAALPLGTPRTFAPATLSQIVPAASTVHVLGANGPRHVREVRQVAFSPDGKRLASIDRDGHVYVWDVATGRALGRSKAASYHYFVGFQGDQLVHTIEPTKDLVSPADDGRWLLTTGDDDALSLVEIATARSYKLDAPKPMSFSIGGSTLVAITEDQSITVGPVSGGARTELAKAAEGNYALISPDGKQLVRLDKTRKITLQPLPSGAPRTLQFEELTEANDGVTNFTWSPDGGTLALVIDSWQLLGVIDTKRGTHQIIVRETLGNDIVALAFSPDGRYLAGGTKYGNVRLWDARTGARLHATDGHIGTTWGVAITDDGNTILSSGDERALLWSPSASAKSVEYADHEHWVQKVAISADGSHMVSCSDYGDINVRALPAGTIVAKLQVPHSECEGLEIRGNEIFAATGTEANIFPIRNEAKPRTFKLAAGRKYGSSVFAVTRDGTLVASAGDDGKLAVHASGSGAKRWVVALPVNKEEDEEEPIEIVALAFDARGQQLATVGEDGIVRIYDAKGGKQLRTYKLPMAPEGYQRPTSLAWVGTRVAIGRVDGKLQLHDAKSKPVFEAQHHEGGIFSLAANAKRLVAGTEDGSVLVWDLP